MSPAPWDTLEMPAMEDHVTVCRLSCGNVTDRAHGMVILCMSCDIHVISTCMTIWAIHMHHIMNVM